MFDNERYNSHSLFVTYINNLYKKFKKDFENELAKQKNIFKKILIVQIVSAILADLYAISINGIVNHNSMVYGIPFMVIEIILYNIFGKMDNSEKSAKIIKIITIIEIIIMGIIIFTTGMFVKNGGNVPITQ